MAGVPDVQIELACLESYHWRQSARYPLWPGLLEISDSRAWRRRSRFLISQFVNPARLYRRALATDARIVHLSNINHLTFAYWNRLASRGGVRVVATAHDIERPKPMINRAYEDRQLKRFYRRADALLVHSRAQAAHLQAFADVAPERIHCVSFGPFDYGRPTATKGEIRARLGVPPHKKLALFFGNIRDEKNLELLLRSMPAFRDELHLLVAGRGDAGAHRPVGYYRTLAKELSLEEQVEFLDHYIPDDQVPDLFEACDWAALPYSRSFTSQSGVLNVAMSYRRPVLATDAPTLGETLTTSNVGVVVESDSVRALADGIRSLHERLSNGSTFDFENYLARNGWASNVRQTIDIYRSLSS